MRMSSLCLYMLLMFVVSSVSIADILSSETWSIISDEGSVSGNAAGSYASAVSDGSDDWVTSGASGAMSVWTTVGAELDWEYFVRVYGRSDAFIRDNQWCTAIAVADANALGPEGSDTLHATALTSENENGSWYDTDDATEPDGIWRYSTTPYRFFANEGVSASHDVAALAVVPLESDDRASAWAIAEAWCDLYVP